MIFVVIQDQTKIIPQTKMKQEKKQNVMSVEKFFPTNISWQVISKWFMKENVNIVILFHKQIQILIVPYYSNIILKIITIQKRKTVKFVENIL